MEKKWDMVKTASDMNHQGQPCAWHGSGDGNQLPGLKHIIITNCCIEEAELYH